MAVNPLNNPIQSVGAGQAAAARAVDGKGDGSFSKVLMDSINEVNRLQSEAADATNKLATGQTTNVAEVMVAVQKADVAFDMLMQIRNKLMDAYQEVQQMRL
ncbi:MAG: Flagellar hook-basal body complex protein FliE [Phycisphaerae bacterium]|nr:Flagellar hook-basal body complex protein FliE [Phycisphaerae bacterium]